MRYFRHLFLVLASLVTIFILVRCSNPAESELDESKLETALNTASMFDGIRCVLISKDNLLLREKYFNGTTLYTPMQVRSVTKSVMSLLTGIAIQKGLIASVNDSICTYLSTVDGGFPVDKKGIKISHLLNMSGGFRGDELADISLYTAWAQSADRIRHILDVPLDYTPGTHFSYDSRPYNLLSVILSKKAGVSASKFAEDNLFTSLGVLAGTWLNDSKGYNNGSSDLYLTARDMIQLGNLISLKGLYNGKQLVPAEWIEGLMTSKIDIHGSMYFATGYSNGFWLGSKNGKNYIFATGWGGQFIVIVPELKLVIAAATVSENISDQTASQRWYNLMSLIVDQIIPAFK